MQGLTSLTIYNPFELLRASQVVRGCTFITLDEVGEGRVSHFLTFSNRGSGGVSQILTLDDNF